MNREEYNTYKRTILQYHIYELIFNEGNDMTVTNQSLITQNLLLLENNKQELLLECCKPNETQNLFKLRWYNKPAVDNKKAAEYIPSQDYSIASTQCSSILNSFTLEIHKETKHHTTQDSSTIIGILRALLKTINYYCKICKTCIMKNKDPTTIISEYCKKVYSFNLFYLFVV